MREHAHETDLERASEDAHEIEMMADKRSDLLTRKYSGRELSSGERERLKSLTARLREIVPTVALGDLEVLLEMGVEADRIREHARLRRLGIG